MTSIWLFFYNLFLKIRLFFLIKSNKKDFRFFKRWSPNIEGHRLILDESFDRINNKLWRNDLYTGFNYDLDPILNNDQDPPEYYLDDALVINRSALNITTQGCYREVNYGNKTFVINAETSLINSSDSFAQHEGYFEIRCKVPLERGMNFKFSLESLYDQDLSITILDINTINRNLLEHSINVKGRKKIRKKKIKNKVFDMTKNYFVYGCKWTPNRLEFYFQNVLVGILKLPKDYDQPMYLNFQPRVLENNIHKNTFMIDYIRVYNNLDI